MNRAAFALILLVNGLVLGTLAGLYLGGTPREPRPEIPTTLTPAPAPSPGPAAGRYTFQTDSDGGLSFFDSATGRHITFHQVEGLWFVMTYDPESASVSYTRTTLVEDDAFLEAAQQLREALPERLQRELQVEP